MQLGSSPIFEIMHVLFKGYFRILFYTVYHLDLLHQSLSSLMTMLFKSSTK